MLLCYPDLRLRARGLFAALLLLTWLVACPTTQAQAPAWAAATSGGSEVLLGTSSIQATAVDGSGNAVVAGFFTGRVAFGSTVLTSAGGTDIFVAKWMPATNTWAWARRGGGNNDDQANAVAVSGSRVYIAGSVSGGPGNGAGITFDGAATPGGLASQSAAGGYDMLVAAYTDNGNSATLGWTQVGGGQDYDFAYGVAASGNRVYVTGYIANDLANSKQVVFGSAGATTGTIIQAGTSSSVSTDIVVAQYTDNLTSATVGWTQVGGGGGNDIGLGIAVNGSRVYVVGGLVNNLSNGAGALFGGAGTTAGTAAQCGAGAYVSTDAVLACYTDNTVAGGTGATFHWAEVWGGNDTDRAQSVAVSGTNVYVSGYIKNDLADAATVRFGGTGTTAGTVQQNGASTAVSYDAIVACYDVAKTNTPLLRWAQVAGGTGPDFGTAVVVQGTGVYLAGYFTNNAANTSGVVFGGTGTTAGTVAQPGVGSISTYSDYDFVVARYTDAGSPASAAFNWALAGGGVAEDRGLSLAVSGTALYVGGYAKSATSAFGTSAAGQVAGTTSQRAVVAQLTATAAAGTWQAAGAARVGGTSAATAVATDASGNLFVTGYFSGQLTLGATTLTSAGAQDLFVAKYLPATGTWAWATSGGGTGSEAGQGIAVSGNRVYVTGYLHNDQANSLSVLLGGTGPATSTTAQAGASANFYGADLLLAAYTDNGTSATLRWAQVAGGTDEDQGTGVAVSGGSVYVTGYLTNNTANSKGVLLGGTGLAAGVAQQYGATATSSADVLVAKYTDNGATATFNWSQIGGGTYNEQGAGIAVNGPNVYVTGSLYNGSTNLKQAVFGGAGTTPGTVTQLGIAAANLGYSPAMLLAKYTDNGSTGTLGWTQVAGGEGGGYGQGVAVNGTSVYVTGNIYNDRANTGHVVFGGTGTTPGTLTQLGASTRYSPDVVLAKYVDNGPNATVAWTQVGGGTDYDGGQALAVSGKEIYLTGYLTNTLANGNSVLFGGSGTVAGTQPQAGASVYADQDLLVAHYTDNGSTATLGWTKVGGGGADDQGYGIAIGGTQVFVGGYIRSTATFDSFVLNMPNDLNLPFQSLVAQLSDLAALPTRPAQAAGHPAGLALYPNPASRAATLTGATAGATVQVLDALGRVVATATATATGTAALALPLSLPVGLYVVQSGGQALRLVVE